MKYRFMPVLFFFCVLTNVFSQSSPQNNARVWGDGEAALQYAQWAVQAIEQGRWNDALTGLERASDFADVSSDISYLLALARSRGNKRRSSVVAALDMAIDTNRWVIYDENYALLLKASQLNAMRKFYNAVECLDRINQNSLSANTELAADAVMVRLIALRGLAENLGGAGGMNPYQALTDFRNLMFTALDRFPRDPRPLQIFFGYAYDSITWQTSITEPDMELLELVLRRLPFLLETEPELAWMAASFVHDIEEAVRLVSTYRAGGFYTIHSRDFYPNPGSIAPALNLGLIGDREAVEELFSGNRGYNYPLPSNIIPNGNPVLEKDIIMDVYYSLGSDEGRALFTEKLHSFSGLIISNDDHDGFIDGHAYYREGVIREIEFDRHHDNFFDLRILFSADGIPVSAEIPVTGQASSAEIQWERYPSVGQAALEHEKFRYRPADFQFAPVSFITIGGSNNHEGLAFPVLLPQYLELTRRILVLNSMNIQRPSAEFNGGTEQIFLDGGIPLRAIETLNGITVSVTEFERGSPVIQYADLDLDGRMETVRFFHTPGLSYPWPDFELRFDYHKLIASSESDWTGNGQYKTGEMYLQDGSVVYLWDMDGGGIMNYSEKNDGNR